MNTGRIGVALILILVVFASAYELVSNEIHRRKTAEPVTFSTIASHEEGDKLSIEGRITFGSSVTCNSSGICTLYLEPITGSPDPGLFVVLWMAETTPREAEPNSFYLPMFFEDKSDFRLYTDDGRELRIEDPVRITGTVHKITHEEAETSVYIIVEKAE